MKLNAGLPPNVVRLSSHHKNTDSLNDYHDADASFKRKPSEMMANLRGKSVVDLKRLRFSKTAREEKEGENFNFNLNKLAGKKKCTDIVLKEEKEQKQESIETTNASTETSNIDLFKHYLHFCSEMNL